MDNGTLVITLALVTLLIGKGAGIYQHYQAIQAQKKGKTSAIMHRHDQPDA